VLHSSERLRIQRKDSTAIGERIIFGFLDIDDIHIARATSISKREEISPRRLDIPRVTGYILDDLQRVAVTGKKGHLDRGRGSAEARYRDRGFCNTGSLGIATDADESPRRTAGIRGDSVSVVVVRMRRTIVIAGRDKRRNGEDEREY
jgi:hypothetical protein